MDRSSRIDLPGIAQHIVQRSRDRLPCFFLDTDRQRYLDALHGIAHREYCNVHAYVLMDDHVHLLVTPMAAGRIDRMMRSLRLGYERCINARHRHRAGPLWQDDHEACPVVDDRYVLRCQRYIELNSVRARMVDDPMRYPWSSHRGNASSAANPLLVPHRAWSALGADAPTRQRAWRSLVEGRVDASENEAIRLHLQRRHFHGPDKLRRAIAPRRERTAAAIRAGAPRPTASMLAEA